MSLHTNVSTIVNRIEHQFGLSRGILLAVGMSCLVLGALASALPFFLFGSLSWLVGVVLVVSGVLKGFQLLVGLRRAAERERSWPAILLQVAIDVAMGLVLMNHWRGSVRIVTLVLGLLFLLEALVLLDMALRSPTLHGGKLLLAAGLATLAISLVILLNLTGETLRWAGVFVGMKLMLFGGTLSWIALRSPHSSAPLVYEPGALEPEAGELYAVYFGTAFHLGVYIGDGEIVHYLNDNHVHRVTWERFLEDRIPQHWTYPDLTPVPVPTIAETALSEVGKTYPYSLLKFNCENFAIYCKSGGRTRTSMYAQVAGGMESVKLHPFIGLVAEVNTRAVEWLAFHFGGPLGKQFSLSIRRVGAAVTNWLVALGSHPLPEQP